MKPTFLQKIQYRLDNSLSKSSFSMVYWLAFFMFLIILFFAIVAFAFDYLIDSEENIGFLQHFHNGFWQLLAPGPGEWESAPYVTILLILLGIVGLLVASILIGLVSSSIEEKIEDLRRGRSPIMETNHIIIYGWTPKIFLVIKELITANENQIGNKICILGNCDKVEMENAVRENIEDLKTSEVICRSGDVMDVTDINIMNPQAAKSIIILPPDDDDESAAVDIIKTLLAILNSPFRKKGKYNIVTEINDASILKVAQIVGEDEVTLIQTDDIIARIMVQTCRQVGLSSVYNEILAFERNEIYFKKDTSLSGKTFKDLLLAYIEATPIGIVSAGKIYLNPDFNTVLKENDSLICIAVDDSEQHFRKDFDQIKSVHSELINRNESSTVLSEKTLIVGWNNKAYRLIDELNNYVAKGSSLTILSKDQDVEATIAAIRSKYENLTIDVKIGSTTNFGFLEEIPIEQYDHVILLSYDNIDSKKADSYSLVSLIQLRDLGQERQAKFNIVSEMQDIRNKELAQLAKPDDFIISTNITGLLLAQLSENSKLKPIFEELFSADGSEIHLKPISDYIQTNQTVNYGTIVEAAAFRNEIALGYRKAVLGKSVDDNFGIVLNPSKKEELMFEANDTIIILSHS